MIKLIQAAPGSMTDMIFDDQQFIGCIGRNAGARIVLSRVVTEQTLERIKRVINKRDGTNRDVAHLKPPPRLDHPRIQKYLLRKYG